MSFNIGIDGVGRETKNMYVGVDGVSRKVLSGYIGVDGVARPFLGGYYQPENNERVLNLSEGQYLYSQDPAQRRIMAPGRYKISIESGSYRSSVNEVVVKEPFYMVAFCKAGSVAKDNGFDGIGTIFGGRAGTDAGTRGYTPAFNAGALYGCILHFVPYNGTFPNNYLYCFHISEQRQGTYGGGAGGRGARLRSSIGNTYINYTGGTGVSGAGGTGGTGGTGTKTGQPGSGNDGNPGNPGNGIGAGVNSKGSAAWFNGTQWNNLSVAVIISGAYTHITVEYLGENN